MKNRKYLFYSQCVYILSKRFYKLYHYVAETFYPNVIETIVTKHSFWIIEQYDNVKNKLYKTFWRIIYEIYWLICGSLQIVIMKLLYLIGKYFYPNSNEYERYDNNPQNYL